MEITFNDLFSEAHLALASASASVSRGSRPLGNAPACRETKNVFSPAETAPVDVVAQPEMNTAENKKTACFINFRNVIQEQKQID